jgi:hypothetical protein
MPVFRFQKHRLPPPCHLGGVLELIRLEHGASARCSGSEEATHRWWAFALPAVSFGGRCICGLGRRPVRCWYTHSQDTNKHTHAHTHTHAHAHSHSHARTRARAHTHTHTDLDALEAAAVARPGKDAPILPERRRAAELRVDSHVSDDDCCIVLLEVCVYLYTCLHTCICVCI